MPIGVGSLLGLGSSIIGGLSSSGAQKDGASQANAANQQAISEAKKIAQEGYDKNNTTIGNTGQAARGYLQTGYNETKDQFRPIIETGDQARGVYANATGLNGEEARGSYVNNLMARPEYAAARDLATRQTQQQYGNKLGSGAFARSLQRRDMEFANKNIDTDLNRMRPLLDQGTQGRGAMAQAATNYGNNQGANEWKIGNSLISNQNKLTDSNINLASASGANNAANATAQGNADANAFSGISNAFSSAFGGGGNNGGTKLSSFFS
jgi:hypothetical protein